LLTAARIAAAAATGIAALQCGRRPRVSVLATGSELAAPGEDLRAGQIYESNTVMLASALTGAGGELEPEAPAADDEAALREALERGLLADVLVTSGGVSVGGHDLVRAVERELGVEEVFWRVSMKPGKPISFGTRGETLVFGLPGNPVSALVGCELFVKPAVRALQGLADPLPRFQPGRLSSGVRRNSERDEFVRAGSKVEGDAVVLEPVVGQESHMIARSSAADVLVHIPRGNGELAAGSAVRWLPLGR
jgi:molybdopterin molybdotransferase